MTDKRMRADCPALRVGADVLDASCSGCADVDACGEDGVLDTVRACGERLFHLRCERTSEGNARVRGTVIAQSTLQQLQRQRVLQLAERAKLTPRERDVLDLVLLGRSTQETATALGISARTARFHEENVLRKLGAEHRYDLMRLLYG